jgi:hypothetical protein
MVRLDEALTDADDREYRANLGLHCWTFMDRAWSRRLNAAHARSQWNLFRYAGAVIPVIAAGAGGSLVGHVHGVAGSVIGWVALIGGLVGAAINAVRPAAEYGVDLKKAAEFEQLYWDVFNYAMAELPKAEVAGIPAKLDGFSQRMVEIAVISAGSTATASLPNDDLQGMLTPINIATTPGGLCKTPPSAGAIVLHNVSRPWWHHWRCLLISGLGAHSFRQMSMLAR